MADNKDYSEMVELSKNSSHSTIPTEAEEKLSPIQAVRKWPKITVFSISLATTILLYGFDSVIVGTVSSMPAFQEKFGALFEDQHIIPSSWLAAWNAASPIGLMGGAIFGGWLQDRAGRRWSLAAGSVLSVASVAICYASDAPADINGRRAVFFIGKLSHGLAVGALMCAAQTYLSEIVPHQLRAAIMAFFPMFKLLGQLIGALVVEAKLDVADASAYRDCFASQWPFSGVVLIVAFLIPESPTWLIRKRKPLAAQESLRRLEATKSNPDTRGSFDKLNKAIQHEESESRTNEATYKQCFQGIHRRRTLLICYANTVTQLFGSTMLGSASYFLQVTGLSPRASIMMLLIGIALGLVSNISSWYTLARFGRRSITMVTLALIVLAWGTMGIAGCFSGSGVPIYTAISLMGVVIFAGIGVWPAAYAIAAETSSLQLRAKAQGIGWFTDGLTNCIFGIVAPYIYNPDQGDLGAKTGFFWAGTTAIGLVGAWLYLPEMKGRTQIEIDRMFEMRLPAKDFKNWNRNDVMEVADK